MPTASVAISVPPAASDELLTQRIASAVRRATGWPPTTLDITADNGTVTVHGRASSFYEKQLVVHAVRRVPGVRNVVDRVDVAAVPR